MATNWQVSNPSDGKRVITRGGGLSVHVRAAVAGQANWWGSDPATPGATKYGAAALGVLVGAIAGWVGSIFVGPTVAIAAGAILALVTALIAWHLVNGRTDACAITPDSVLATLVEYAEHRPTEALDEQLRAVAKLALARAPRLGEVDDLTALPALVRSTAIAHHLAASLGVAEVAPGLVQLWEELDWTPTGVLTAAERVGALSQELIALGRAQQAVISRAEQRVTELRAADLADYQRKLDDTLAMGREAIQRETQIRQATLDEGF